MRRFIFLLSALLYTCLGFSQSSGEKVTIPHYPQWMYEKRLSELDKVSLVKLDYNRQVQAFINVYTVKRREHLARIIGRSELYFPLFEEYLNKYDLPLELKYLAIVESALDPKAKSKSAAMGLWQFLYQASRMFELKVNNFVDERCDPVKSTEAACRYLRYLYDNLNDWQLALAAYNGGLGVVQKAIQRSGGKTNFWELQPYLPAAVKSYVPAFIAVNYAMNNYRRHEIEPQKHLVDFSQIDSVYIHKSISFKRLSEVSQTSLDVVKWLNPSFIRDFIPVDETPVLVYLPTKAVRRFILVEKNLKEEKYQPTASLPIGDIKGRERLIHKVSKGEFFHKIAIDNQCRISDIMHWNQLKKRYLYIDQELVVWRLVEKNPYFFVTSEIENIKPVLHVNRLMVHNSKF